MNEDTKSKEYLEGAKKAYKDVCRLLYTSEDRKQIAESLMEKLRNGSYSHEYFRGYKEKMREFRIKIENAAKEFMN
jgi:hypothetical protein